MKLSFLMPTLPSSSSRTWRQNIKVRDVLCTERPAPIYSLIKQSMRELLTGFDVEPKFETLWSKAANTVFVRKIHKHIYLFGLNPINYSRILRQKVQDSFNSTKCRESFFISTNPRFVTFCMHFLHNKSIDMEGTIWRKWKI